MSLRPVKFGTDGWRGIVGDDVTFEAVRHVARGIAAYLAERGGTTAVVGYDRRFASEVFADDVARVLAHHGIRALLFQEAAPTQVASWTVMERQAAGGVVITASHNPYLFNGVKYKPETGSSAPPEVIADLERRINAGLDAGVERSAPDDPGSPASIPARATCASWGAWSTCRRCARRAFASSTTRCTAPAPAMWRRRWRGAAPR